MKQLFLNFLMFLVTGSQNNDIGYLLDNDKKYNWKMFLIDLIAGAVIATVVGVWVRSWGIPLILIFFLCGASAVFSKEIMRAIRKKVINSEIEGGV